jgi:hypothetical protein
MVISEGSGEDRSAVHRQRLSVLREPDKGEAGTSPPGHVLRGAQGDRRECARSVAFSRSGLAVVAFVILVSTSPGAMPLTRMPSLAQASPSVRVRPIAPVLEAL